MIELLVVVAIIALLISILLPSLSRARETARTVACSANLRSFGLAKHMYADSENDFFVPIHAYNQPSWQRGQWGSSKRLHELMGSPFNPPPDDEKWDPDLLCPSAPAEHRDSGHNKLIYGVNYTWVHMNPGTNVEAIHRASVPEPTAKAQLVDANNWRVVRGHANPTLWEAHGEFRGLLGGGDAVTYRHANGANILHFDGHVGYYSPEEAYISDTTDTTEWNRIWWVYGENVFPEDFW